jgi:hypothetical protein
MALRNLRTLMDALIYVPSESDFGSFVTDRSRAFEDLSEYRKNGPVLLASRRLLRADDVGEAGHVDLEGLSDLLADCTAAPG